MAALTESEVRASLADYANKLEYLNNEMAALKEQIKYGGGNTGNGGMRFLVDLKHLSPEKYTGPRGNVPFRQWSQDIKDLVSRYSGNLLDAMGRLEYQTERISMEKVKAAGVTAEENMQLRSATRAFTQGEPRAFINTAIDRGEGGLEIWRTLVSLYDPDNDNTRLDESTFIMCPGKAKNLTEVQYILSRWEDAINHRAKTLGRAPLDDDLNWSVLLKILPDAEEKELRNIRAMYKSFEALRARVLEIVNERSKGPAPMLYNITEDDTPETDEEGEWIMKIDIKNGQKKKVWTKVGAKGGGKGGRLPIECYRCGRPGHIRGDCKAHKHINGGEPKEYKKRGLNHIEQGPETNVESDLGGIDICMLEEHTVKEKQRNPFGNIGYIPNMPNPFLEAKPKDCTSESWPLFGAQLTGSVMVEAENRVSKEDSKCDKGSNGSNEETFVRPAAPERGGPVAEPNFAKLYSANTLQGICLRASGKICKQVRAAMELVVENVLAEMQNEIDNQEIFKVQVVKAWQPMETFEDCKEPNQPEEKCLDILAFDDMDVDETNWEKMEVTVDSGAAHSVADGDVWPTIPRMESLGSKAGSVYLGPGKEKIPNRGQKSLTVKTEGNPAIRKMTFQDAAVRKPLAAVSGITDKGNVVLFDKKGSFIAPADCPEVTTIRELIRQIKHRIELERKKGVYVMPIWVQTRADQKNETKTVFSGQGK